MATQVARLESTLAFNDVQFTQGIERAEKRSQTFAAKVEKNFIGIFKRDPSQRAENAVSNLIGDITSGNTAQGLAQFAGRISGLGIIAGVGIGAAIDIFDKLRSSVLEVREAHDQLNVQMGKPLNLTSIEGLGKAIDNLRAKQNTFAHSTTNFLSEAYGGMTGTGSGEIGVNALMEQQEISEAIARRQAAERLRGRNELIRANVLSGLEDDPKRKALAEMRFKFDERRDALRAAPDKGTQDRLKALDIEQDVAERNFRLHKADNNARLDMEEKIARLARLPATPEQRKQLQIGTEIKGLDAQIAAEKNPNEKRRLELLKFNKQTELRGVSTNPNATPQNPFAFGTTAARDFDDQGFGSLAKRNSEMNDASVFGSLGYNAAQRGETALPKQEQMNAELLAVNKELLAVTREAWSSK